MLYRSIFFVCMLFVFAGYSSADQLKPSTTLEIRGGLFEPATEGWKEHYGDSQFPELGISFAYRFFWVFDVGFSVSHGKVKGPAQTESSNEQTGEALHQTLPIDVFIMLRGRFSENQWIVPYIGGGYTRFAYRQEVADQSAVEGSTDGSHVRMGVQFLLDALDKRGADFMYRHWGVINSYLIMDYKQTSAKIDGLDIGGESYSLGLLFEYN